MSFSVTSNSFKDGDYLANDHVLSENYGFGCAGNNQSPHLSWGEPPAGTEIFAVTSFDPDAPTGSGVWTWLVITFLPLYATWPGGRAGPACRPVLWRPGRTSVHPAREVPERPRATTRTVISSTYMR